MEEPTGDRGGADARTADGSPRPRVAVGTLVSADRAPDRGERFITLASLQGVMIEEILSSDAPAPDEQVQDHDEWVLVLDGAASLEVDGTRLELRAGQHVVIAAGTPHRVLATRQGTRWLAVHIGMTA